MLYIYLPVLYYHGKLYVTEGAYAGGQGFPLSQRSFLVFQDFPVLHFQVLSRPGNCHCKNQVHSRISETCKNPE